MRHVMKDISFDFSRKILESINTPPHKLYFFLDNWYVKHEDMPRFRNVRDHLKSLGAQKIERVFTDRVTDLEYGVNNFKNGKEIWGEGEIRILVKK
tara:strand:- start:107 stop:394 length:288 start_codon:yes stop_codon:yes gene_type:complete